MRAGGYSVHQTLTTEAANIVKQAISLARRRNHAQVTPLHVATAMLASSNGLLRKACLHSHSHPLQCKALELCFNVALNRLPTTTSSPLLGPPTSHHHHPALSNALVAAFKRAQAHQRRGTIENQQQPILALKVELDQLVISMLDDPSVSRVMREAGFSSPQVRSNVEQAVSLDICSQTPSITKESAQLPSLSQFRARNINSPDEQDMRGVIDSLMSKKRKNTVVVGECLDSSECLIRGVIDKFKRGDVPEGMRGVQFISLPLLSLKNLPMYEAEKKLEEVRCLVRSYVTRGVVLYLGDLKWVSEFWANYGGNSRSYYCPVELMIMEISRLLGDNGKVWVMGIASFKTLMRCKTGQPSLETLWQLQSLTVPVGSLGLSLNLDSELHDQFQKKSPEEAKIGMEKNLNCCADCLVSFNREAQTITGGTCYNDSTTTTTTTTSSSGLPSWLQQYKEENNRKVSNDQEMNNLGELCKKWNSMCSTFHKQPHFLGKALNFASASPSPATSISSHQTLLGWPSIFESPKERQFLVSERTDQPKPELLSNPNSSPNSASSSEADEDLECLHGFKELNSRNLKALCNALEKRVPWQSDIIPDIAKTVLECRSGRIPRKGNSENNQVSSLKDREETWLFFLGVDGEGKENIAKELAKAVFGSLTNFVTMGISSISSLTRADSSELEATSNKRARDESGSTYLDRFAEAVQDNPSRVFFMEDIEQVDCFSQKGIKKAIENGRIGLPNGDLASLKDAIVVFSCESFSSMSRASSPPIRRNSMERKGDDSGDKVMSCSLDLNIATEDDSGDDHQDHSVSDVGGILDLVDRKIIFKVQLL